MAGIAENPQIGVVLRVAALRDASAGVRHGASALKWNTHGAKQGNSRGSAVAADSSGCAGQDGPASRPLSEREQWPP